MYPSHAIGKCSGPVPRPGRCRCERPQPVDGDRTVRLRFPTESDGSSDSFPCRRPRTLMAIPDKRTTEAEVVSGLRNGMTIGIGGWGSRRKPMSLVRELLRSDLEDLTIVSYGGPDIGLLCRAGKVKRA